MRVWPLCASPPVGDGHGLDTGGTGGGGACTHAPAGGRVPRSRQMASNPAGVASGGGLSGARRARITVSPTLFLLSRCVSASPFLSAECCCRASFATYITQRPHASLMRRMSRLSAIYREGKGKIAAVAFLFSVVLAPSAAQQALCGLDEQQTNCSSCLAVNQPDTIDCLWSQLPSSTASPGGTGASCVSQTTFFFNKQTSPANAGYGYCPTSTGCDGLDSAACTANAACDWFTNINNILGWQNNNNNNDICRSAFAQNIRARALS